jgi:hypothetical protein
VTAWWQTLALCLVGGLVVACDASATANRTPNLIVSGEPNTAIETATYDAEPGRPYSWTSFPLCLDRPGQVVIEKAEIAERVGQLRIEAFGVKPLLRDQPGQGSTLQDLGHPARPSTTVDSVCAPDWEHARPGHVPELIGFQLSKSTIETAIARGIVLTYRAGTDLKHLTLPHTIALCAPGDDVNEECQRATEPGPVSLPPTG